MKAKISEADPGFLESGFTCIMVLGFVLLSLSHISYISYENDIIWSQLDQIISFS